MTYVGIDYGMQQTNIDTTTGIRYGVIPLNHLPFFLDEAEPEQEEPHCPYCGNLAKEMAELTEEEIIRFEEKETNRQEYTCLKCLKYLDAEEVFPEESVYSIRNSDYVATLDSDNDVWITKSPFFTYARFCSPCAPGACDLSSPLEERRHESNKCYCPPPDSFEIAPFDIYSVQTGLCIAKKGEPYVS